MPAEESSPRLFFYIFGAAVLLGAAFWIFDGVFQFYFFHHDLRDLVLEGPETLMESLFTNVPARSVVLRVSFILACLLGGAMAAFFAQGQKRARELLLKEISEREKTQKALLVYQDRLKQMGSELSLVEERERRRLAVDLHDNIGQLLAAALLKLKPLRLNGFGKAEKESLEEVMTLLDRMFSGIRDITFDLSPPILFELGLGPALDWLAEEMGKTHKIGFSFSCAGPPRRVAPDVAMVLFRAARELMMNVIRHSQAGRAALTLLFAAGGLELSVRDDGIGFDVSQLDEAASNRSFGLFSINERLVSLGGGLRVETAPGAGTAVALTVPYSTEAAAPGRGEAAPPPAKAVGG
ncbi:MAG: sensor histidine kinase [Pseudomonadota bacterium]